MVVAAAGSGKTSTMVAKTGYALHEGLATPDQILLLAFNKATAEEVGQRIAQQSRREVNTCTSSRGAAAKTDQFK